MRRVIGLVLVGLGAFLLVLAAMLRFYAVPALAKAPLSPGENSGGVTQTDQEGIARSLFDPATLTERKDVEVTATRFTRGDVPAAETEEAKSQDLAVYDSFLRLEDPEGVVVNASTIRVAFDRVTSELVNCCGVNNDGAQVTWEGINPLKFPMFTQQQDYDYFDTTLNKAYPAKFMGVEELEGLEVYKFQQVIEPTEYATLEVPGDLVGADTPSYEAPRFYGVNLTMWVEPTTGSIVKGVNEQLQTLRGPDGTDQVTIIDSTIGTSPAEVTEGVEDAKSSAGLIKTLNNTVPLIALILGIILVVVGFLLAARRSPSAADSDTVTNV
ncbi:MAG: DUF3068 domain-containing protein [Candidatus Nanopelagicales bacterium]